MELHLKINDVVHNPLLICALSKNPEVNFIEMTRGVCEEYQENGKGAGVNDKKR